MPFIDQLRAAERLHDSMLCVGLDPEPSRFPGAWKNDPSRIYASCAAIVEATRKEMAPLREKHREARRAVMDLLAKPTVDRAAIEAIRAQEIQSADAMSRRFVQSLADVAEVLTPEQRAQLAEKMKQRRGHRGHG